MKPCKSPSPYLGPTCLYFCLSTCRLEIITSKVLFKRKTPRFFGYNEQNLRQEEGFPDKEALVRKITDSVCVCDI